ncbi:MAG: acyl-CoA dehydrogenase family protein [Thermodesulfobacteriota bacterium]
MSPIRYGLSAEAPDLAEGLPALARLKLHCPDYVRRAEDAQRVARRFAREELLPKVLEIDTRCSADPAYVDWNLWRRANEHKLTISPIPEKLGGLGWSALGNAALVEELASVCMASAANITFNTFGLLGAMVECRTGILMRIIRQMVAAQKAEKPLFWSWAITEPGAGTDMEEERAMKTMKPSTSARKVSGGYRLNGTKCFITNGSLAQYVIANIPLDPQSPLESMATFLIPASSRGFSVGRVERKCGQKASQTAELFFQDVFVPEENLWEPPGRGLRHTREILSITRGYIGLAALGMARGAFERAVQYAARKQVRHHRLIDEEWVQFAFADMLKEIAVVRSAAYEFALALDNRHVWSLFDKLPVKLGLKLMPGWLLNSRFLIQMTQWPPIDRLGSWYKHSLVPDHRVEEFLKMGSALKVAGTDLAVNVTSRVLDVVGLEGMAYGHGIEKYFRDAKITQIYEGTNQVNRMDLFHHEIGRQLELPKLRRSEKRIGMPEPQTKDDRSCPGPCCMRF